jgi:hypothetical protein
VIRVLLRAWRAREGGAGARDGARVWTHMARVGLGARERVVGGARAGREASVVARDVEGLGCAGRDKGRRRV